MSGRDRSWSGPRRRSASSSSPTTISTASRNGHFSRKAKCVPSKSSPRSADASAPASRTGRKGRMPMAAASPMPWSRSKTKCMAWRASPREPLRCRGRMTIDETPRGPARGGESPDMGKPRSSAREIERYAGLFARRTQVMKSSAMRDLMAVTARPEIISLAGGLPDTSTFPAEDFAALMTRVGIDDAARALQYGPTEGLDEVKACIAQVMAAEGMEVEYDDLLVTTGGQQVIDLVCKTLIDPGDVIVAEAPTYPGAVPVFVSYQADVVQIELD